MVCPSTDGSRPNNRFCLHTLLLQCIHCSCKPTQRIRL
jgi:hypothetical protein